MLKIGIDIDNTINMNINSIIFFSLITNSLKGKAEIHIISNRDPFTLERTKEELGRYNIYYDHIRLTAEKSAYIINKEIEIYFDDTDEYFLDLPHTIVVFKIRETFNFDFKDKKWNYNHKTGKII